MLCSCSHLREWPKRKTPAAMCGCSGRFDDDVEAILAEAALSSNVGEAQKLILATYGDPLPESYVLGTGNILHCMTGI